MEFVPGRLRDDHSGSRSIRRADALPRPMGRATVPPARGRGPRETRRGLTMALSPLGHEPHKIKTVRLLAFPSLDERKRNLAEAHFNVFNLTTVPGELRHVLARDECREPGADRGPARRRRGVRRRRELREPPGGRARGARARLRLPDAQRARLREADRRDDGAARVEAAVERAHANRRAHAARRRGPGLPRPRRARVQPGTSTSRSCARCSRRAAVAIVGLQAFADGQHPFSLENLKAVRALAQKHGVPVVLDGSRIIENAWYNPAPRGRHGRPHGGRDREADCQVGRRVSRWTVPRTRSATRAASSPPTTPTSTRS